MFGACAGDVIGSYYENRRTKELDFELLPAGARFTDDSVLTIAQAEHLLDPRDWVATLKDWSRRYPNAGYGPSYVRWAMSEMQGGYGSWGNGSAMRVSPVGWAFDTAGEVLAEAEASAAVTHDHPEGIKGAQAVALAVFRMRTGGDREELRAELAERFGYRMDRAVDSIRPGYRFEVSCQMSVPEALLCFLESADFEGAVRRAVSLGGDADTQAAIAGAVAEAAYGGVPPEIAGPVWGRLDGPMKGVLRSFYARFAPDLPLPEDPA